MDYYSKAKEDFKTFVQLIWLNLGLPNPTKVQLEIAEFLQGTTNDLMVQAFRGVGKSWITSAYVVWRLWNDPSLEILVISATGNRSKNFSTFTQKLITEFLSDELMPDSREARWSKESFDVKGKKPSHSPSVRSASMTGQITGDRADLIIADDIEIIDNSTTADAREKLRAKMSEFINIKKPEGGQVIFLGTPQSQDTVYSNILNNDGYVVRIWTAEYPKDVSVYNGNLAPSITEEINRKPKCIGHATDPQRFDDIELAKRKAKIREKEYLLQYMLDTSLTDIDKYPLKLKDLVIASKLSPDSVPLDVYHTTNPRYRLKEFGNLGFGNDAFYEGEVSVYMPPDTVIMAIDPSGRGTDETSYVILAKALNYIYVLAVGGLRDGYSPKTLNKLGMLAKQYNVSKVILEPNYGGGMFTQLLKPVLYKYHPCMVEEVLSKGQKEKRILETLEPVISNHKLVIDYNVVQEDKATYDNIETSFYSLFYQMTRMSDERNPIKHDDRLDVLAIGVGYFVKSMAIDEQAGLEDIQREAWEHQMEYFESMSEF